MREGGQTSAEADWHQYKMEERIVEILNPSPIPRPLSYSLTIYQIAIEFAQRYEPDFVKMGRPLGGIGAGQRASYHLHGKSTLEADQGGQIDQNRDAVPPSCRHGVPDLQV